MTDTAEMQRELEKSRKARHDFIRRVRAEESEANRDPKGYRRKVIALIALAHTYIFGVLAFALLMLAGLIYLVVEVGRGNTALLRGAVVLALFVAAILRSLWVTIKPPKGVVLRRGDAPGLYKVVDGIAEQLQAPKSDDIRIDHRLNAAASQTPRLGMFGFYRNTLVLGLPLLMSLSPDEMRAVIAHEFGHFSGSHGKFGARVYRVEETWRQLGEQLAGCRSWGSLVFAAFVRWFQPRFSATTFALRRANEFAADKAGAEIAGAENMARALMRMEYLGPHLQQAFWKDLAQKSKMCPTPPTDAFAALHAFAQCAPEDGLIRQRLERALSAKTDYNQTHPSLTDRLKALKGWPLEIDDAVSKLSLPPGKSAAEAFLGPRLPSLIGQVESLYWEGSKEQWAKNYAVYQRNIETMRNLREKKQSMPLTETESVNLAFYAYQLEGAAQGETIFRELREELPKNPLVAFWLGRILAEREDMSAEPLLREAVRDYPNAAVNAMKLLAELYRAHGKQEELEALHEEAADTMQARKMIDASARIVVIADDLVPHGLAADRVTDIAEQLLAIPNLSRAYLVKKVLPNGELRLTLIAFHQQRFLEGGRGPGLLTQALIKELKMPERWVAYSPAKERKHWIRRLDAVQGAKIFDVEAAIG